jgi:hypothetical protein
MSKFISTSKIYHVLKNILQFFKLTYHIPLIFWNNKYGYINMSSTVDLMLSFLCLYMSTFVQFISYTTSVESSCASPSFAAAEYHTVMLLQ